jgi:hypothetical protein
MAQKVTMSFKKGDNVSHEFRMDLADYTAGGNLFFAAKPLVDNDATDAAAVIDKSFTDASVTLDDNYATWDLAFVPADIAGVNFTGGEKVKKYLGEFQFVADDGTVSSFPNDDSFIEVIVYADIKRGTS